MLRVCPICDKPFKTFTAGKEVCSNCYWEESEFDGEERLGDDE